MRSQTDEAYLTASIVIGSGVEMWIGVILIACWMMDFGC
jgi:hypothetical protein